MVGFFDNSQVIALLREQEEKMCATDSDAKNSIKGFTESSSMIQACETSANVNVDLNLSRRQLQQQQREHFLWSDFFSPKVRTLSPWQMHPRPACPHGQAGPRWASLIKRARCHSGDFSFSTDRLV